MGLLPRLEGTEDPKIHVHTFMAALGEAVRGGLGSTNAERLDRVALEFSLDQQEQDQLAEWAPRVLQGLVSRIQLHDILILLEEGIYTQQEVLDILRGV